MNIQRFNTNPYSSVIEDDSKIYWGRSLQLGVEINNGIISWGKTTLESALPAEKNVLDNIPYGNNQIGILGKINKNNLNIDSQIRSRVMDIMDIDLPEYKDLAFLFDLSKNNYNQNKKRYGILSKTKTEKQSIGCSVFNSQIEILLVNSYNPNGKSDEIQKRIREELEIKAESLRLRITNTNGGLFKNAFYNQDFTQQEIEFNDEHGLATIRMGFSLDIHKNLT